MPVGVPRASVVEELVPFRLGVIRKDQFQPSQQGGLGSSFERRLEIFGRLRTQLRRQQGEQFQSQGAMEGAKVPGQARICRPR